MNISYLLMPILFFIPWIILFGLKKDSRKKMFKTSLIGGFAGLLAEFWYFKDYWHPPLVLGESLFSLEDFFFGFTIVGITTSLYDTIFSVKVINREKKRKKLFGLLFLCGVALMLVFNIVLGVNSIIISCGAFLFFAVIIVIIRPDLLKKSVLTGFFTLIISIPVYAVIFNIIDPTFWKTYWMLSKTPYGITIFGNIPATELLWYFTWGCLGGIAHDFSSGNVCIKSRYNTAAVSETEYVKFNDML